MNLHTACTRNSSLMRDFIYKRMPEGDRKLKKNYFAKCNQRNFGWVTRSRDWLDNNKKKSFHPQRCQIS